MNERTQQGINALKAGDRETARSLLAAAIKQNPNDATAWLWLAGTLSKDEERVHCLQQVLRIEPGNAAAARALAQIQQRRAHPAAVAHEPQVAQPTPSQTPPPAAVIKPQETLDGEHSAPSTAGETPTAQEAPATVEVAEIAPAAAQAQPAAGAAEPAEAAVASVMPAAAPARGRRARTMQEGEQVIFHTRPSVVYALFGFWVFLAGAIAIGVLLQPNIVLALSLAIGLGFILEVIVIYAAIRNLTARYELTNYQLTLRFRGQRVRVRVTDLIAAECRQSTFQKLLGTGDLLLDGLVRGELVHLRMRNIPECDKRLGQVRALISTT